MTNKPIHLATARAGGIVIRRYKPLAGAEQVRLHNYANCCRQIDDMGRSFEISAPDAPPPAVRKQLEDRLAALTEYMRPASFEQIAAHVSLMLIEHKMQLSEQEIQLRVRGIYEPKLNGYPAFALEAAFMHAYQYMPTPFDLIAKAQEALRPLGVERKLLTRILSAKVWEPLTPEQVEARRVKMKEVVQAMVAVQAERGLREIEENERQRVADRSRTAEIAKYLNPARIGESLQECLARWAAEKNAADAIMKVRTEESPPSTDENRK